MTARSIVTAVAIASLCGCGADSDKSPDEAAGTPEAGREASAPAASAAAATVTASVAPAACDLVPRAEIERIAGKLDGEPKREGDGCWFYVATDTTSAQWKEHQAAAERMRAAGMDQRGIDLYHPSRAGIYVELGLTAGGSGQASTEADAPAAPAPNGSPSRRTSAPGWDEVGASRTGSVFHGRTGHVRVAVRLQGLRLPPDTVLAMADRVRDRVPAGPIAHPEAEPSGPPSSRHDPCGVLTRAEAEAVLGELVAAPFRTRERTPLAEPSGKSCAYLTSAHHVLVLTPTWDYGRIELDATRMVGGVVRRVADLPGIEGDTLEGAWDDVVVDLTGELLLLKGAHSLGIAYLASSTDAAGAIRLAGPALERLAATPVSGGPRVAAAGCVAEEAVGAAVGSRARLKYNGFGRCSYDLEADPTISIELAEQPGVASARIFSELRQRVKTARGENAEPERIGVGEEGWAYSAGSQSEAAARRGEKLYHARMSYAGSSMVKDSKDAMVQLVARMME